jgi:large subunit ribosomal protein L5
MSLLKEYQESIAPKLQKELGIKNPIAVPRFKKVTLNVGFGSQLTKSGEKTPDRFVENLAKISGQKPEIRYSRKSISNFKLRAGMPVGARVTLRRQRMYDFLERFITVSIPRIRDFRGMNRKGDGNGNISFGIKEHTIFPEVGEDEASKLHGIEVTFTTTAQNNNELYALLEKFNFPFKK